MGQIPEVVFENNIVDSVTIEPVESDKQRTDDMDLGKILGMLPIFILIVIMFIRIIFVIYKNTGQKTRNSQQRRPYNTRQRQSVSQAEPTIYVSPANFPPPPKYEAMAPPSYDEVVGIHYPNYQVPVQPITQPITTALAQSSNSSETNVTNNENTNNVPDNVTCNDTNVPSTVLTVTNERVNATASS